MTSAPFPDPAAAPTQPAGPSDELLRDLCENAGDIVYAFDLAGRFQFFNRMAERLTGYGRDELLSLTVGQLLSPEHRDAWGRKLVPKLSEGGHNVCELDLVTKTDQRVPVEINSWLLTRDGQPYAVQGIARDVTERKRAEEERRRLEARLQQTQKLESLAVLAGGVAHEFNNILTGVLGRADLALADLSSAASVREHLEQILVGGRRAAVLTAQLLAYAGGGRHVVEPLDLSALVRDMADLIQASATVCAVTFELPDGLPLVEADVAQTRQIVLNLINNAVEALGSGGGPVQVRTGARRFERVELSRCHPEAGLAEGDYVFLEVADAGCGMTTEVRERMFEPFFSTKFAGRGLGLAAVLGIVRRHGGVLHIDSVLGQGTTVRVLFPPAAAR